MGKSEDSSIAVSRPPSGETGRNAGRSACHRRCHWVRCLVAVAFGLAVALSAVFWLPPFLGPRGDSRGSDLGSRSGAKIVASFKLQRNATELRANAPKLRYDIYDEIGVSDSMVIIYSMDPLGGSNWTNVVFGILPYPANSTLFSAGLSILRSYFESFVIQQSTLHLSPSLFGNPSLFQVLEFPGGITIVPQQNAFLLQKVQIVFNFTLKFSIYQVQTKFSALKKQMRTGLHLAYDENLYISLTNMFGSTLAPPTIVEVAIFPVVGAPSNSRMKELYKSISGSSSRNLGLNHTLFGRIKQIQLSSYLQHPLNGTNNGTTRSPSPAPYGHRSHKEHHHHHHHHRHHHHHHRRGPDQNRISEEPLAPAPTPQEGRKESSSSGCQDGFSPKCRRECHLAPSALPPVPCQTPPMLPKRSPAPAPDPLKEHSYLSSISLAHSQPPSQRSFAKPPNKMLPKRSPAPAPDPLKEHSYLSSIFMLWS